MNITTSPVLHGALWIPGLSCLELWFTTCILTSSLLIHSSCNYVLKLCWQLSYKVSLLRTQMRRFSQCTSLDGRRACASRPCPLVSGRCSRTWYCQRTSRAGLCGSQTSCTTTTATRSISPSSGGLRRSYWCRSSTWRRQSSRGSPTRHCKPRKTHGGAPRALIHPEAADSYFKSRRCQC